MVPKTFYKKICNETTEFIPHTKMMPECRNVTKQNCVTKWETDAEGKQVSAATLPIDLITMLPNNTSVIILKFLRFIFIYRKVNLYFFEQFDGSCHVARVNNCIVASVFNHNLQQ